MPITSRTNLDSRGPWEPVIGYGRAVKLGDRIYVSGTTATDAEGGIVGVGDPYAQAAFIIRKIETALKILGAELSDVVRTRVYVTDITDWPMVARAHLEAFGGVLPTNSLLAVSALIAPELLVEIEADAELGVDVGRITTEVADLGGA